MRKKYNILHFPEIHSTNSYAMENLADLQDRLIIIADKQTMGRGRFDRKWISDKVGNVYLSIVLKDIALTNLTPYLAETVCNVLQTYGIKPQIKEPNDVMVDGKKICGILAQASTQANYLKGMVIGVGVNLNLNDDDLEKIDQPAISLNLLLGKPVNRDDFIEKLLDEFFKNYPPPKNPTISSESPSLRIQDS